MKVEAGSPLAIRCGGKPPSPDGGRGMVLMQVNERDLVVGLLKKADVRPPRGHRLPGF